MGEQKKKSSMTTMLLLVLIVALVGMGVVGWMNPDSYPGKIVNPLRNMIGK